MGKQLVVIDGADEGRAFPLREGTYRVGSGRRHSDICLHDLWVAQVHCQVQVAADRIVVTDTNDRSQGTFINGHKVTEHELHVGDVLRVGNSHMRLVNYDPLADVAPDEEVIAATPVVAGPAPRLPPERLAELSGHMLGHFEIGPALGKGHFGVVFRARDTKANRPVALKVLSPQFPATPSEMERFVQAIKAMPGHHPHLVNLLGAGRTGTYSWLALEYVEGEDLAQVMLRLDPGRKIHWQRAVRVGVHVGRALDFIHQKRFVHGNITPHNILIQASDKVTKLGDLTLARALEGSALHKDRLEGKLLSELPYLAPEQVVGGFVDGLTDLYSLGVIIYALLVGRLPFAGKTPEDTLQLIQEAVPAKPTKYQRFPEELDEIVLKMLARLQEDRTQSAAEVVAQLQEVAEENDIEV